MAQRVVAYGSRFTGQADVQREQVFHQVNQFIHPMIVYRAVQRNEHAKLPVESQNVPRIDKRPALNGPMQQVFHFRQQPHRFVQPALVHVPVASGDARANFAQHPAASHRNDLRLSQACFRISHFGEQLGQFHMLQLRRP